LIVAGRVVKTGRGSVRRYVAALGSAGVLLLPTPTIAEPYRNDEFGFSALIPRGYKRCRAAPLQRDHGVIIWLDAGPTGCADADQRPYVSIAGNYNVLDDLDPTALIARDCGYTQGVRVQAPLGLSIKDASTASCGVDGYDGWIVVLVVAQAHEVRGFERSPGDVAPAINYDFTLHTKPERFTDDLERFRLILSTIRLFLGGF
jgi:hypothetical protein